MDVGEVVLVLLLGVVELVGGVVLKLLDVLLELVVLKFDEYDNSLESA